MKNKVHDIVPLQVTDITVPDTLSERKTQGNQFINPENVVKSRQSVVPAISIISGMNSDDEGRRDNYLQGSFLISHLC